MNARARRILQLDAGAGGAAGLVFAVAAGPIIAWTGHQPAIYAAITAANLLYAAGGALLLGVARARGRLPRAGVWALILANAAWACVCVGLLVATGDTLRPLGWAHLLGEGAIVATLAAVEARWVLPASAAGPATSQSPV